MRCKGENMKQKAFAVIFSLGLLLSGCGSLLNGEYIWTEKYEPPQSQSGGEYVPISNYLQLQNALEDMVENGVVRSVFSVAGYDTNDPDADFTSAVRELKSTHPIAAYSVDQITYEAGTIAGNSVLVIEISYLHNRSEIRDIITVQDNAAAMEAVYDALANCQDGIVLQIQDYRVTDFARMVEVYALENPHKVMEMPRVVEDVYPKTGKTRVVALDFHYQTSFEDMKAMQSTVASVFSDAKLHVAGNGSAFEKYSKLYAFLMDRYDYIIEATTTPTFSLLYHGIGDSRAFAMVYSAMCRQAGLECILVSGTRDGQSWYWNIIRHGGVYYHLDLIQCDVDGEFAIRGDDEMSGYVWDYTIYPTCGS
jgi:hypothetical protein